MPLPVLGLLSDAIRKNPEVAMNFGLGLMAQSGPSPVPTNLGASVGKAALGAQQYKQQLQQAALANEYRQSQMDYTKALTQRLNTPQAPPPPETREIKSGGQIITEQWNPVAQKWEPLAEAPRFQDQKSGNRYIPMNLEQMKALRDRGIPVPPPDAGMLMAEVSPDGQVVDYKLIPSPMGRTPEDREAAKRAGTAAESAQAHWDAFQSAVTMTDEIAAVPGATGIRGWMSENVGGLAGQISPKAEEALTKAISNASPEDVAALRTRGRQQVAEQLAAITAEESGRFTEAERALAQRVLATVEASKSIAQVLAAQKTLARIYLSSALREDFRAGDPRFNAATDEGKNKLGNYLNKLGVFSEDEIVQMIREAELAQLIHGQGNG